MKRIFLGLVGMAMVAGTVACNERDVAVGAAAVSAGFIAGAVYDHNHGRNYRHRHRGYDNGGYYWDRYDGRWNRDGRGNWRRGRGWNENFRTMSVTPVASVNSERAVASKYNLRSRGAREVVATMNWVRRHGRLDAFREIGMTDNDIVRLGNGGTPGSTSIRQMADHLNASTSSVRAIILDLREEFSLQRQHGFRL